MEFLLHYGPYLLFGILYGFIFGIIPVAGAKVALLGVYSFIPFFQHDPYTMVVFTTAVVVSCTIGDQFASVVMNIPGGGGSAATMVDGFPLAKRGEAARALSAGLFSCGFIGLLWGVAVIVLLPYYHFIIQVFGIPEMWCLMILSFTCVCFVTNNYWIRGMLALMIGIGLGLVGTDPTTNAQRFTMGWFYLADGIQLAPLIAGVLAVPEIISTLYLKSEPIAPIDNIATQMRQGFDDCCKNYRDALRGSLVGGFIGIMPGIGGNIVEWLAYGQTVAATKNPDPQFGEGNVKTIVAVEGASVAQKATAYVPAVLFGIPSAPFEAIVISLLSFVGIRLGTNQIMTDALFFDTLSFGFMASLVLTVAIGLWFIRYAANITRIPFIYYAVPVIAMMTWACVQYTGGWEDYAVFVACCALGFLLKKLKFNRAAFIIGFVLADRLEALSLQFFGIYSPVDLLNRPISLIMLMLCAAAAIYGLFFNRTRINYT